MGWLGRLGVRGELWWGRAPTNSLRSSTARIAGITDQGIIARRLRSGFSLGDRHALRVALAGVAPQVTQPAVVIRNRK